MSFTSRLASIMSLVMPYPLKIGSPWKNSEKLLKEAKVNQMKKKDAHMLVTKTVAMAEENGAKRTA